MNILWLAHRDPLNPNAGGNEAIIYEVSKFLIKRGNKVTIVTGGWDGSAKEDFIDGVHIIRFGKIFGPHLAAPFIILRNKYDLVICDLGHVVPWFSPVLLRKRHIVSFVHLHKRSLRGQVGRTIAYTLTAIEKCYSVIYHNSRFLTISSTSYMDLVGLGVKRKNITIIKPGVDHDLFKPSEKTIYPSIVYFGGMRAYKRPDEAIFLTNRIRQDIKNVKLFMVGIGPELRNLKNLSEKLNLSDVIEFTGRLNKENLSSLVARSWLNVHTSITEGFGISIIEAASCGTPTVAYDVPGIADSVEDGGSGIKVSNGDREALADAVFSILRSPERWWASSKETAKKYSWDKTAELWEKLIQEIVGIQH
jgi:glycosyltransferase involved in cell wall biosynthesis